jgi:hypothetical protein
MNRVETIAFENRNSAAIKFARPAIQLAIRHYRRLEKFGDLIRRQVEPKIQALRLAQARIDEIEADHELIEAIKQANRRKTDGERNHTPNDKYRIIYAIGKLDTTDLAAENDTLTGAILSKS